MGRIYRDGSVDVKSKGILTPESVKGVNFPRLLRTAEIIGNLELRAFSRQAYQSESIETASDYEFSKNHEAVAHHRIARFLGGATLTVAALLPLSHIAEPTFQAVDSVYEDYVTGPLSSLASLRPEA